MNKGMVHLLSIVLFLALSGEILAADQDPQQQPTEEEQKAKVQEQVPGQASPSQNVYKASELLDKKVENKEGEDLGKITELVIDKSGKVRYAVLSHGGVLDMGAKMTAVSWKALDLSPLANGGDHYILKLNITKEQLPDLPTFSVDNWPSEPQLTEHSTFNTSS